MADREVLRDFSRLIDLFLADLKLLDPEKHLKHTGSDNAVILENFEFLVSQGASIITRVPLIPGVTATEENIRAIALYVHRVDPGIPIELINYNPLAKNKYRLMELNYPLDTNLDSFSEEEMERFRSFLREEGITPYTG
jgi:pyruvate formate lyase activating enzyme